MRDIIDKISETLSLNLSGDEDRPESPAKAFLADLEASSDPHPFNHRARLLGGAQVEVSPSVDDRNAGVHINDVVSHEKGAGTKAMRMLCDLADRHGVTLDLHAKGYAQTPTAALVKWYSGLGFVEDYGDEDYGFEMIREPHRVIKLQGFAKRPH